jgi:hypothetical protein
MGHLTRIANTVVHNLEKGPVHAQISGLITGWVVCFVAWIFRGIPLIYNRASMSRYCPSH